MKSISSFCVSYSWCSIQLHWCSHYAWWRQPFTAAWHYSLCLSVKEFSEAASLDRLSYSQCWGQEWSQLCDVHSAMYSLYIKPTGSQGPLKYQCDTLSVIHSQMLRTENVSKIRLELNIHPKGWNQRAEPWRMLGYEKNISHRSSHILYCSVQF